MHPHEPPSVPLRPAPPPPLARYLQTQWWFLVPLLSAGLATFVMVLYGGYRLKSKLHMAVAVGYLIEVIGYIVGVDAFIVDSRPYNLVVGCHVLVWTIGTGHVVFLQRLVRNRGANEPPPVPATPSGNTLALAQAAARAQRRREAQELVVQNPVAAFELKVGRPDVPNRQFDDGGLIDINHVPAEWLVHGLEITPEQALQIVEVRQQRGGFLVPDEVMLHCPLIQPARFELIRDRLTVLPF
ncbi:hypothetical protein BJY16_006153 [Actinoplanes octamycinicus]|uniref:Helix-hairpin-helix protein n=1 Tax=Actinoplanes octamycinicus TaxID=135948 RepID=A0A7W7H2N0_9ACTN|nr:hypothetical protein [Actinoplanes octamycinicus]MBB4742694.1 hypothetical protein [Actinoplanes octamycinicus]